jgi:hypothetical protein
MAGKIEWLASFAPTNAEPVAEIYDAEGKVASTKPVACRPPVNCPFIMADVSPGTYTAALTYGGSRYYYVEGQSVITTPNDAGSATAVEVTETVTPFLEINVDAT